MVLLIYTFCNMLLLKTLNIVQHTVPTYILYSEFTDVSSLSNLHFNFLQIWILKDAMVAL